MQRKAIDTRPEGESLSGRHKTTQEVVCMATVDRTGMRTRAPRSTRG